MPKYLVQHRRGTAEQWAEQGTLIPREGEIVIEIDEVNSLHKLKIGDGVHTYAELAYLQAGDEIVTQVLAEAKPRVITVELSESWAQDSDDKYYQTLTLSGITNHSRLDLQPSVDMLAEFKQLGLVFVTENNSGVITVYSVGNMPQKAYTMQATIVETECDGEDACIIGTPIGTPVAQSNWSQTDNTKADFIKNKPTLGALAAKNEVAKTDLASDVQMSLGKADTAIQSIDGLATEGYVDNKVGALGGLASKSTVEKTDLSTDVQASLNKADTALQSFTETDPTVPAWAKAASKPTYTASEVGADVEGSASAVQGNLDTHTANKSNPHEVTAAQVGALPISGGTMTGEITLPNNTSLKSKNPSGTAQEMLRANGSNQLILGAKDAWDLIVMYHGMVPATVVVDSLDIGAAGRRWKNLYLSGNLSDGTNSVSIANIAKKSDIQDALANIPTPDVSGQINTHNSDTSAHNDIRASINSLSSEIANLKASIVTVHSGTEAAMTSDVGSDGDVYLVTE